MNLDQLIPKLVAACQFPLNVSDSLFGHLFSEEQSLLFSMLHPFSTNNNIKKIKIYLFENESLNFSKRIIESPFKFDLKDRLKKGRFIVQLTDNNNKKNLYRFPSPFADDELIEELAKLDYETTHYRPYRMGNLKSFWDNLLYAPSCENKYEQIHEAIKNQVIVLINSQITKIRDFIILDIGTGTGKMLNLVYLSLVQYQKPIKQIIGIDINEVNIDIAKNKYPNYTFFCKNSQDIDKLLINKNPGTCIIITSSGSMTREVINGSLVALDILQKAYRIADFFILSGITELIVNHRLAKNAGFIYQRHVDEISQLPVVVLFKNNHYLSKFNKFTNHFDLSFHSNPILALKSLPRANSLNLSIDLGMSGLMSIEIDELLNFIRLHSVIKIFVAGIESWLPLLKEKIKNLEIIQSENSYISTSSNGHHEILKFSPNFYERYKSSLFNKKIESLSKNISSELYNFKITDQKDGYYARMNQMADDGDDTACYILATHYSLNFQIKKGSTTKPSDTYALRIKPEDKLIFLEKSLSYWHKLSAKGYPVLNEIDKVNFKVEEIKNQLLQQNSKLTLVFSQV